MGIGNIIDSETMYEDIIKELSRSERVMVRFYLQLLGVLMMLSNVMQPLELDTRVLKILVDNKLYISYNNKVAEKTALL